MRKYTIAVIILFSASTVYRAQDGTAENGHYPAKYFGTTFTGSVISTNDETREVALGFTNAKNGKTQTFIGVIEEGYLISLKDGGLHELKPSEIGPGALIKVYYLAETRKVGEKKTTINTVFLIGGTPNARVRYQVFKPFR